MCLLRRLAWTGHVHTNRCTIGIVNLLSFMVIMVISPSDQQLQYHQHCEQQCQLNTTTEISTRGASYVMHTNQAIYQKDSLRFSLTRASFPIFLLFSFNWMNQENRATTICDHVKSRDFQALDVDLNRIHRVISNVITKASRNDFDVCISQ